MTSSGVIFAALTKLLQSHRRHYTTHFTARTHTVSSIFHWLTSPLTFLSFTPAPSIHYPLPPIHTDPSLNAPLCPLSLYLLFFSVFFTLSLPPALPPVSRSLPAMQTLKVNLHSKVLLLASATVTERFFLCASSVLLSFFFPLLHLTIYMTSLLFSCPHLCDPLSQYQCSLVL